MKKKIIIMSILITILITGTAYANVVNTTVKQLSATFRNIKIYYNGMYKMSSSEPFIVNGTTYVPLRFVAEMMDKSVNWNDATSVITINDNQNYTNQITFLEKQLQEKAKTIEELRKQIDTKSSSTNFSDLTEKIEDDYETYKSIDFEFDLDGDSDDLEIDIEFDYSKDGSDWNDLSSSSKKSFIEDVCELVWDEDKYEDTDIEGTVTISSSNKKVLSFTAKANKTPSVRTYSLTEDLEDDLEDEYDTDLHGIRIDRLELELDDEDMEYTVEIDFDDYQDEWDDLSSSQIENYMEDIASDIEREFDEDNYDITGKIVDSDDDEKYAEFEWEEDGDHYFKKFK